MPAWDQDPIVEPSAQPGAKRPAWEDAPIVKPPAAVSAPKSGYLMGLRDPVDALAQIAENVVPSGVATKVNQFNNWLADKGLPLARVEESDKGATKLVRDVNKQYDQQRRSAAGGVSSLVTGQEADPGFDWGRLAGNVVNPVTIMAAPSIGTASTFTQLAARGAAAGAMGGLLQPVTSDDAETDFWKRKGGQAAVGAVTGAVATPIISKTAQGVARGVDSARRAVGGRMVTEEQVRVAAANAARANGVNFQNLPQATRDMVEDQVRQSLRTGQRIDPAAIMRRVEAESVGLTGDAALTTGQVTRNPMLFTQERNMRGVEISTPQGRGNPLMERFANQNRALSERFGKLGADQATDQHTAGQTIIDSLRRFDEPIREGVDGMYQNARSMAEGRTVHLDHAAFSQAANEALDRGMWGRFVPPEVRGMLNDITEGKVPLTVENEVQIDGILSAAQRKAGRGTPEWSAIGQIRTALQSTPFARTGTPTASYPNVGGAAQAAGDVVDNGVTDAAFREIHPTALPGQRALPAPPGRSMTTEADFAMPRQQTYQVGPAATPEARPEDAGQAARDAFAQARRAARNRFAMHEENPALQAALDNAAPDNFIRRYVLGGNAQDLQNLRQALANDAEAMAQARAQIANHLRRAAFGENPTGDKTFAANRYMETLRAIGAPRLSAFFSPEEIQQFTSLGRVASNINTQPAGSAVNNSNTGSAVMTMLSRLSESPILRNIPGARAVANQVGEMQTEAQIRAALSGQVPAPPAELSPELVRAINRLLPLGGAAAGSLGGVAGQ